VALSHAAHGSSLCTLDRQQVPAAKYYEGAVAALGDTVRALRRGDTLPDASRWGERWQRYADVDPGWRAYLAGGREALRRLA